MELLQRYIPMHDTDFMHTRLADVLTITGNYTEALDHYKQALSKDPSSERAEAGLARVQKLLNGDGEDGVDDDGGDDEMMQEGMMQDDY